MNRLNPLFISVILYHVMGKAGKFYRAGRRLSASDVSSALDKPELLEPLDVDGDKLRVGSSVHRIKELCSLGPGPLLPGSFVFVSGEKTFKVESDILGFDAPEGYLSYPETRALQKMSDLVWREIESVHTFIGAYSGERDAGRIQAVRGQLVEDFKANKGDINKTIKSTDRREFLDRLGGMDDDELLALRGFLSELRDSVLSRYNVAETSCPEYSESDVENNLVPVNNEIRRRNYRRLEGVAGSSIVKREESQKKEVFGVTVSSSREELIEKIGKLKPPSLREFRGKLSVAMHATSYPECSRGYSREAFDGLHNTLLDHVGDKMVLPVNVPGAIKGAFLLHAERFMSTPPSEVDRSMERDKSYPGVLNLFGLTYPLMVWAWDAGNPDEARKILDDQFTKYFSSLTAVNPEYQPVTDREWSLLRDYSPEVYTILKTLNDETDRVIAEENAPGELKQVFLDQRKSFAGWLPMGLSDRETSELKPPIEGSSLCSSLQHLEYLKRFMYDSTHLKQKSPTDDGVLQEVEDSLKTADENREDLGVNSPQAEAIHLLAQHPRTAARLINLYMQPKWV